MDLIADSLLIGGAVAAAFYCWVLSVRVRSLKDLDKGLGGAIAELSRQVDDMQSTLQAAKSFSESSKSELNQLAVRAERASDQLKGLLIDADGVPMRSKKSAKIEQFQKVASEEAVAGKDVEPAPRVVEITEAPDDNSVSLAEQLQRDIRQRIAGRDDVENREDFVKALQDILAASK